MDISMAKNARIWPHYSKALDSYHSNSLPAQHYSYLRFAFLVKA